MDVYRRFRLDGSVAIVTGGGRGIGKAIALHFAEAGADLVVTSLHQETVNRTAEDIKSLGKSCLPLVIDNTKADDVRELVAKAVSEFRHIDILVNNVGANNPLCPATKISEEDWEKYVRVNLTSTFLCSKEVGRIMIDQGFGNIINISSAAGTRSVPGLSAYGAAKAGINHFTKTLAVELSRFGIRVNCIVVGAIETELGSALRGTAEERVKRAGIPLGRIGQPEDIALAAVYLASEASSFVTGSFIEVTGGPITRKGDVEMFVERFPEI